MTALIVPKNLGYAGIAGVPLQNGLYAAAAGALIYALFCTSRQISTGPSSSLAAVAGGAVLVTGLAGDGGRPARGGDHAADGLLYLLLAVFRLGWIAQFLSKAVVTGFLAGAAVDVVDRRAAEADRNVVRRRQRLAGARLVDPRARRAHWATLARRGRRSRVILGLRFAAPAVPGALVLVVGGLLASALFDLGAHGVALVGDVPRGLPTPELPDLDVVRRTSR